MHLKDGCLESSDPYLKEVGTNLFAKMTRTCVIHGLWKNKIRHKYRQDIDGLAEEFGYFVNNEDYKDNRITHFSLSASDNKDRN